MKLRIEWSVTRYEAATVDVDPQAIRDAGYNPESESDVRQWARTELTWPEAQSSTEDESPDFIDAEIVTT